MSLVPEKREEITTEGGLDATAQVEQLISVRRKFKKAGILFSLFIDPEPRQMETAHQVRADSIEINTGLYTELKEYRVLARKYRPQTFASLIGQEVLVRTLTNAITNNRIAHAYLLTGVRGIGKTTTARLIAMSLNCEERPPESSEPCSKCKSCISIRGDHNIDVIEIDAASRTGVDDIREIIYR